MGANGLDGGRNLRDGKTELLAAKAKPALTQRRRATRRNAEEKNSLRISGSAGLYLCVGSTAFFRLKGGGHLAPPEVFETLGD
jgi:hypothetical protein